MSGALKPFGKFVHYVESGVVMPALVVHCDEDGENLVAWTKDGEQIFRRRVLHSEKPLQEDRTWFIPMTAVVTPEQIQKLGRQYKAQLDAEVRAAMAKNITPAVKP